MAASDLIVQGVRWLTNAAGELVGYRNPVTDRDEVMPTGTPSGSAIVSAIDTELGSADWQSGGGAAAWGGVTGTLADQADLQAALDAKQDDLVSGTNIKTVNGTSLLGAGNVAISGGASAWGDLTGTLSDQTDLHNALHVTADYSTANAMGALAIDTSKQLNTKTVAADSTLTFSAAPSTANTYFGLAITNSDTAQHTITIPSSYSLAQQAAITSFILPAGATAELIWRYDGTTYVLSGEPVRDYFSFTWSFVGTASDRDYGLLLKSARALVIEEVTSKCTSGTGTATVKIEGVALGGTANSVSSTEQSQAHTSANSVAAGNDLTVTFASTASCVDPQITVKGYKQ